MAGETFDAAEPADTGAILTRLKAVRDNNVALERMLEVDHEAIDAAREGQHVQVTLYETTKPTADTKTGFVYTVNDTTTELAYEDAAANEVQLTKSGKVYVPSTNAPSGVAIAWAYCNAAGTLQQGYNLTSASGGLGIVVFTVAGEITSLTATFCAVATPESAGVTGLTAKIVAKTTTTFTVQITNTAGTGVNAALNVVVYGTAA